MKAMGVFNGTRILSSREMHSDLMMIIYVGLIIDVTMAAQLIMSMLLRFDIAFQKVNFKWMEMSSTYSRMTLL